MTDRRIVVDEEDVLNLTADLEQWARKMLAESIIDDAPSEAETQADALVDAAEVIKLRIQKKMTDTGSFARMIFENKGRGTIVLGIEIIMYRWLMARSEAIRSRDAVV